MYEVAHRRGFSLDELTYLAAHGDSGARDTLNSIAREAAHPPAGPKRRLFRRFVR